MASEGKAKVPLSEETKTSNKKSSISTGEILGQDSIPLVPTYSHDDRGSSVISQYPPSLEPMKLTGTGRLSVFSQWPSAE